MQSFFYVVSPLITLLAVLIAFLALLRQSRPQVLIHYRPNPGVPSIIDLVIENIGTGTARDVRFSHPLPARCYGIEKPNGKGEPVLSEGVPALAPGQALIFDGGQFAGLKEQLGAGLEIRASYLYRTPIGLDIRRTDINVLTIDYLRLMTTRKSGEQALVDAMEGRNNTVFITMNKQLANIGNKLYALSKPGQCDDDRG